MAISKLENRCTRERTVGSNPTPSAIFQCLSQIGRPKHSVNMLVAANILQTPALARYGKALLAPHPGVYLSEPSGTQPSTRFFWVEVLGADLYRNGTEHLIFEHAEATDLSLKCKHLLFGLTSLCKR